MSKNVKRPDWIPLPLWKKDLYKIWKAVCNIWQPFYQSEVLHKIYFYLAQRVDSCIAITGYTVYLPYANNGSIVRVDCKGSSGSRYIFEININVDKQVVGHRYHLSE